jgi:hypothetical protein
MPTIAEHLANATDAYLANVPPFLTVAQCRAFISACAKLIALTPSMSGNREGSVQFDLRVLAQQQTDAQQWLDNHGGAASTVAAAPRVTYADFRNVRS